VFGGGPFTGASVGDQVLVSGALGGSGSGSGSISGSTSSATNVQPTIILNQIIKL
jgi:hypothetical protein